MVLHEIEFKIGDKVTLYPYEKEYKRVVIGVKPHQNAWGYPDERVWYELATLGKPDELCVVATGLCIKESIYFGEYGNENPTYY